MPCGSSPAPRLLVGASAHDECRLRCLLGSRLAVVGGRRQCAKGEFYIHSPSGRILHSQDFTISKAPSTPMMALGSCQNFSQLFCSKSGIYGRASRIRCKALYVCAVLVILLLACTRCGPRIATKEHKRSMNQLLRASAAAGSTPFFSPLSSSAIEAGSARRTRWGCPAPGSGWQV